MDDHERRTATRFAIRLGVAFTNGEELRRHAILNLSEGGLFIRTSRPLPIGTDLEMMIQLGSDPPLLQRGCVAWVRDVVDEGMGVRFVGPINPHLAALLPPHRPKPK